MHAAQTPCPPRARTPAARAVTYLHCPRCRLAIRRRADYLTLDHCPRCLARTAIAVPLFTSPLSAVELRRHDEPEPKPAVASA